MTRMSRMAAADLLDAAAAPAPRTVMRAREIQRPTRAAQPLPAPSDWTFELLERYHQVIRQTATRYGLDTYP
ncbi:MAG: SpoVR family protein, partial [Burkholderiaceae bacterium]